MFLIISFLAFHRVRKERDREREKIEQLSQIKIGDNDVASKVTTVKSTSTKWNPFVRVHKCSKCGWGIEVFMFANVVTCPKCGNADDL